ncbi:MAG: acyl carrier protein, partial [Pseudomonadota bacterium]
PTPTVQSTLLNTLDTTPDDEREATILAFVQSKVQDILGLTTPPAPETGFFDLGMDSLMAVDLKNQIQNNIGQQNIISNTIVFDHPNSYKITEYLLGIFSDERENGDARDGITEDDLFAIVNELTK